MHLAIRVGIAAGTAHQMQAALPEATGMRALRHLRMHAAGFAAVAGFYYPDPGEVSTQHLHNGFGNELEF